MFKRFINWVKNLFRPNEQKPAPPLNPSNDNNDPISPAIKGKRMSLWATFYYLPIMSNDKRGVALLDMDGNKLGPIISNQKFCHLAMQGSGVIDGVVYGYSGAKGHRQADCQYGPSERVRFHRDPNRYGTGVKNWAITPFKSIAVDPRVIPYGSKVYIPRAAGVEYMHEGKTHIHDGIFLAQDTGGKIKGTHIDVYLGPVNGITWRDALKFNPFDFIKSTASGTFEAIILDE